MNIAEKYLDLGKKFYPTWATWEITSRCNAQCGYCYIRQPKQTSEDFSTDTMYSIVDKLRESGILFITLTGGEPFLRKDILSIIDYIIRKDFFSFALFTNGTLMNDAHIQFLIDHKNALRDIQFSVFSHIPEINDAYMGIPGALENTLSVAKRLTAAGIRVMLAFNIFGFNVKQSEVTRKAFTDMGFHVRMSFFKLSLDSRHERSMKNEMTKDFYTAVIDHFDQSEVKKSQERIREKSLPANSDSFCNGLFTDIAIDHQGNILPCIAFRKLPLGSIFEQRSIRDILMSSSQFRQIRSLRRSDIEECAHCRFLGACRVCLAMIHTRNHGILKPLRHFCTYLETLESYSCKKK